MKMNDCNDYIDLLNRIASRYELPKKLNYESALDFTKGPGSLESIWALCNKDLRSLDLTEFDEKTLMQLAFNDFTVFPEECNVDYRKIMEESKNPGLGVSTLHKEGINGKDINVAVIDKPILKTHREFVGRIKQYILVDPGSEHNEMHFHGITCAAFLCGNSCGVANKSNLYYYAYPDRFEDDGMYWGYYFRALDMIIEHNKNNSNDAIRVVSISAGFSRNRTDLSEKMNYYISELKKYNCQIIYSNNFGENFTCSSKKYGYSNDDVNCYCLDRWQVNPWDRQRVLVPAGGRTSPCNSGEDKYMYCGNQSCYSWAIPYLCGVYTLALQCYPSLSYDDFVSLVNETKIKNGEGLFVLNPQGIIELIKAAK